MRYLVFVAALVLAGCSGLQWDSGVSWAPDFIKQDRPKPSSIDPDPPPDVAAVVKAQGAHTFSNLRSIQISDPWPDGNHWKFCARVLSLGATGSPISGRYTVDVIGGRLHNPRLDSGAVCAKTGYRSVPVHAAG